METLLLKSQKNEIHKIERFTESISDRYNIGSSYFANILVSLTEAFNNALVHGNKFDESKSIRLDFDIENSKMVFSITDEGYGFDYEMFLKNEGELPGNGIFLIKHASDDVLFEDGGRKLVMTFNVASFNVDMSSMRSSIFKSVGEKTNSKMNG